jgi:hypothetical protein
LFALFALFALFNSMLLKINKIGDAQNDFVLDAQNIKFV